MKTPESSAGPVFFLLDETSPSSIHPLVSEAFRRLDGQGFDCRLLSIPCPAQPAHPLLADTGPYHPWLTPGLPQHHAVITTSLTSTILGICCSPFRPYWLLDADPFSQHRDVGLEYALTDHVLRQKAAIPLPSHEPLARLVDTVHGVPCTAWPLCDPAPKDNGHRAAEPGILIDHTARSADAVVLAAEAFAGSALRPALLTELLAPPYAGSIGRVRIRPFDRASYYGAAAVLVKLDSFHANLPLLLRMLQSGAAVATTSGAIGTLPVRHAEHVWHVSSPDDPVAIRREVEMLVENAPLRSALVKRGRALAAEWTAQSASASWQPTSELSPIPPTGRIALADTILRDAGSATWNRTLLHMLQVWYDIHSATRWQRLWAGVRHRFRARCHGR